jgi:hypothetical protein
MKLTLGSEIKIFSDMFLIYNININLIYILIYIYIKYQRKNN